MKTKTLKSDQLKTRLPEILRTWHEQESATILAGVVGEAVKKGCPPELAFSIAANYATHWLNAFLLERHTAPDSPLESQETIQALLNTVWSRCAKFPDLNLKGG